MPTKFKFHRRLAVSLALAAGALLALPASGLAATTFGSRLLNEPTDGNCRIQGTPTPPCTYVSFIQPSAPNGDPDSSGAPSNGIITKFRIRAFGSGAQVTFLLANIQRLNINSALSTVAAVGPTVNVQGTGEIEEFPAHVNVRKGNHLAINTSNAQAIYNSNGNKYTYVYTPPLVIGQGQAGSDDVTNELLVQAVIEPDKEKPSLTKLSVSNGIRYTLSEPAAVTFTVERAKKGRKVGRKCKRQTRKNRHRRRCTRYSKLNGSLTDSGEKGGNTLAFNNSIGGRSLSKGRYRLSGVAVDPSGNRSTTARKSFTVK